MKKDEAIRQIDGAIAEYSKVRRESQHNDCSDRGDRIVAALILRLSTTVERLSPPGSAYRNQMEYRFTGYGGAANAGNIPGLVGILEALRLDIEEGYLQTVSELIHAGMFGDFLEMADHLQDSGYKDAAAVVVGSVLEQHLRELCRKNSIDDLNGDKPKKAEALNDDLAASGIYSKLDQKNVTSWLGLRNDAAHGNYASYTQQQVRLFIDSIRDFLTRNPA